MHVEIDYNPAYFLRCHSRKNDSADVQTQVWMCAFEPDPKNAEKTTNIVATCGGNSVCFINVENGEVVAKYISKDLREMFYTLAWATVPLGHNILACAGARNVIHFISLYDELSILQYSMKIKSTFRIQALLFHPLESNILFCGTSNGDVKIFDVGKPLPPDYETDVKILRSLSAESEIFSLAFCSVSNVLLAGCNDGLRGWNISSTKDTDAQFDFLQFVLPLSEKNKDSIELVDSVEILKDGIVATKCALQGTIQIWHLPSTIEKCKKSKSGVYNVAPTHVLHWSDTDNYFLYIGAHMGAGLLCCGDDKGALWTYDISKLNFRPNNVKPVTVKPTVILPWPSLIDRNSDKKRKLNLDVYDIVIDKVCIASSGKHLVAVTNNNMVCVWERCS